MKTVYISGYRGFVGRHFTRLLNKRGWEVIGDDLKESTDCRDRFRHEDRKYDLVIHLAAIVGGRLMIEGKPISVADDLSIDAEMFNWAVRTKQPRVVYFSSSAAYPIEYQNKVDEFGVPKAHFLIESDIDLNHIKNPDLTYGWSKLTGEMLADLARKKNGLKTYVFRPFSGYGEDQDLDYPFPTFIKRAKQRLNPFEVWSDGLQVRDWIHIEDIVNAVTKVVDDDIDIGPVNLGNGEPVDFIGFANMVCELSGYSPTIKIDPSKPRGVGFRCSSNHKMTTFYTPKISLEEGIKRALC